MSALKKYEQMSVWDVPFADILEVWHERTNGYKDQRAIRAMCQWDRYFLLVQVCGRADALHPWVYERCREIERSPDGHLDVFGREHYKSTLITFAGVIQEILRDPEVTIGIFSHTAGIARGFLAQVKRELENNEKLLALFPDILYQKPSEDSPLWSVDKGIIVKRKTNPKEATVEGWGLVDGQPTSKHFSLMVYDDVVTRESVSTPEQIKKTTEAWEMSDNLGSAGGRKQHAGTRYAFGDTYSEIIKRGAVKLRLRPATEDGTITGKPVLFTQEEWDRKVRDQGEATISCQMLGNPLAGKQRMFNIENLEEYEVRPETLAVYILIDPARSKKKDSANTAMVVLGLDYATNKYLLDGFNHKMNLRERWEHMKRLYVRWKQAPGVQQVRVGYESFGAQADMDYFDEQMRKEGPRFEITTLEWPRDGEGSKVDRVQRLTPDINSHRFYLPFPGVPDKHGRADPNVFTRNQMRMQEEGYAYRVARPIKRKDENDNLYDLAEQLKMQIHYFPLGGLKDLVDATSRIYDMQPKAPVYNRQQYFEPEFT